MGIASLICGGMALLLWLVGRILAMTSVLYTSPIAIMAMFFVAGLAAVTGVVLGVLDILLKKKKDQKAAEAAGVQALPLPIGTILISILGVVISFCALLVPYGLLNM